MPIPAVTKLVAACWMEAENTARDLLAKEYPDMDEDFITKFFYGKLRSAVQLASSKGAVSRAFLHDLHTAFPHFQHFNELSNYADRIGATITRHAPETEKKSGGDLGILFVRPNVTEQTPSILDIDPEYHRGLLCQAKILRRPRQRRKPQWGGFSKKQRTILPARLDYLSMLLYKYTDADRQFLAPFRWQLCADAQFDEVEQWIKSGEFRDTCTSERIVSQLGNAAIGTSNKEDIKNFICPSTRETLTIKIGWPPGDAPPPQLDLAYQSDERVRA